MRDNVFIYIIVCSLLILSVFCVNAEAILPTTVKIEDCRPWMEEAPDLKDQIARFDKRIFNYCFDGFIFSLLQRLGLLLLTETFYASWYVIASMMVLIWVFYYPVMEFKSGKTLAKFITRTRVVSNDLTSLESNQAFKRNLLRFIPLELFSFLNAYPRGWHDSYSNSKVVNEAVVRTIIQWEDGD